MRLPLLLAFALIAGCHSQERPDEPREFPDPAPYNGPAPEEPRPPKTPADKADACVRRAESAAARGRPDEARVEFQDAFRRDRWHVPANEGYQDLMLANDLFDVLWREYLDLWQVNSARGDALYFHLRPLLKKRGLGAAKLESKAELPDDTIKAINDLVTESTEKAAAGDRDGAVAAIDRALKLADMPVLHLLRINLLAQTAYDKLLAEYSDRAEQNPQSGDALALHAKVVGHADKPKAVAMLRDGYVLELPGFWLPFTLAELCRDLGDEVLTKAGEKPDQDARRDITGWYACARDCYEICRATRPSDPDTLQGAGYVAQQIERVAAPSRR